MDALIGLLVLAAIVTVFVVMVRRTNAKGRDITTAAQYTKPPLLTPQQRKALKLQERKPRTPAVPAKGTTPKPAATRAIRTGWRVGVVAFTYEDVDGDITYRTVTVHSATRFYLKGECHDRRAERTFRLDRIVGDLADCETGELMAPSRWVREHG